MTTKNHLYILAAAEGFLIMAIELISARLLTPVFGNTIHVWTSVIGITMLSLLAGYYIGGKLASTAKNQKWFLVSILIASLWTALMPMLAEYSLIPLVHMGLLAGTVLASLILVAVPLVLLGTVSPQLIQLLDNHLHSAGNSSGNVYSVSTLGGVTGTFFTGLYLLPVWGIKFTSLSLCGVFAVMAIVYLILFNKWALRSSAMIVVLVAAVISGVAFTKTNQKNAKGRLYESDGFYGKVEVIETPAGTRAYVNNHTCQSLYNPVDGNSVMAYTHVIGTLASMRYEKNNALLVGLAGGAVLQELSKLGYKNIDVADVDPRTKTITNKYFGTSNIKYNFFPLDGRFYLQSCEKKYDVIIIDVSNSDTQPGHLFTNEAFEIYRNKLTSTGFIILNIIDFTDPAKAEIIKKVADSMLRAKFKVLKLQDIYPPDLKDTDIFEKIAHEYILLGITENPKQWSMNTEEMNDCCKVYHYCNALKTNLDGMVLSKKKPETEGFKDDNTEMELLNHKRSKILRKSYLFKNQ